MAKVARSEPEMIGINENQQNLDLPGQPSLVRLIRPSPKGFDSRMRLPGLEPASS